MPISPPVLCPNCGARMNHHADKVVEPCSRAEASHVDIIFDGVLEEFFACPSCGSSLMRMAAWVLSDLPRCY